MDTTLQGYFLTKLDRIEELLRTQIKLQEQVALTLAALAAPPKPVAAVAEKAVERLSFIQRLKFPPFSQIVIGGCCSWGISSGISTYLSQGGDPLKLIEMFLKLFG